MLVAVFQFLSCRLISPDSSALSNAFPVLPSSECTLLFDALLFGPHGVSVTHQRDLDLAVPVYVVYVVSESMLIGVAVPSSVSLSIMFVLNVL
jgi:hypothetical protein